MSDRKSIYDPVHGSIFVDGVFLELMDRHEMQRLRSIRQLGFSNVVFPGANHTRFEHSLGTYHLAGRMCNALGINKEESNVIMAAAMLHDVCHPPFSHAMESIVESVCGCDHMELSRKLIFGKMPYYRKRDERFFGGVEPISVMLEDAGISPKDVCDLIINPVSDINWFDDKDSRKSYFASKDYAHQIIHGPVDADQMDYLMRDAHYTGVNHGSIDAERILSQMAMHNDKVVLRRGGVTAAEGLMVSRSLMYSSIYYHRTVKAVEAMVRRAVEVSDIDLSELYLMTDSDLVSALLESGGRSADIMRRVLNRRLYKNAFTMSSVDADEDMRSSLVKYSSRDGRRQLEKEIADYAGVDTSDVIVDIPSESVLLSKIKIGKTDVSILDSSDRVRPISKYSSVARAIQSREVIDWCVMVSAPPEICESVGRAASKILAFDDADRP